MKSGECGWWSVTALLMVIAAVAIFITGMAFYASLYPVFQSKEWAAWAQVLGAMIAIIGSYVVGAKQSAAAHKSALDVEALRTKRKEDGYRSVVRQLIEEVLAAIVLINGNSDRIKFSSEWNTKRGPAMKAALSAFDSMPVHDMGAFQRIEVSFRVRELCSSLFERSERAVGLAHDCTFGQAYYAGLRKSVAAIGQDADSLKRELDSLYDLA